MTAKKKTQKQIREDNQKSQLRQRLIDMANGAGLDDVECGDYWCYTSDSLERLIRCVNNAFSDGLEEYQQESMNAYTSLSFYGCLDDLQNWLWGMGVRA